MNVGQREWASNPYTSDMLEIQRYISPLSGRHAPSRLIETSERTRPLRFERGRDVTRKIQTGIMQKE